MIIIGIILHFKAIGHRKEPKYCILYCGFKLLGSNRTLLWIKIEIWKCIFSLFRWFSRHCSHICSYIVTRNCSRLLTNWHQVKPKLMNWMKNMPILWKNMLRTHMHWKPFWIMRILWGRWILTRSKAICILLLFFVHEP